MITIPISPDERLAGTISDTHLCEAVAAMREDGAVVLEGAVDPVHVAGLRERMLADVERVLARTDVPYNFNRGNVQQSPPRAARWLFRDVLCNEQAIAVTRALLGPGPTNNFYSGNTALPHSSERQPVHVDGGHLWPADAGYTPPNGIVVNLPLVDMDAGNGSTELWLGSHRDLTMHVSMDLPVPAAAIAQRRAHCPPLQPRVVAGSLLLRDLRLWHAGMPNPSASPRPMIAMIHWASWWRNQDVLEFPTDAELILAHGELRTNARFVAGAIDHTLLDHAYAFTGSDV